MNKKVRKQEITESLRRLATSYAQSIRQLEETLAILCQELELQEIAWSELVRAEGSTSETAGLGRPVADPTTLSVVWRGKACFLGNTLLFHFFERISRRPNRYCSHTELLDEVWGGPRSDSSIRNLVKRLRDRLSDADMGDLAQAIDGSERGHYVLRLDRITL